MGTCTHRTGQYNFKDVTVIIYYLQNEEGEIDTTITGEPMNNWEMKHENEHTEAWKRTLAAAAASAAAAGQ